MQYGIMNYTYSYNLGDEIQSIAAMRFMPIDDINNLIYVDRDRLKSFKFNEELKLILNGWYMHNSKEFPISINSNIDPLLISMHITQTSMVLANMFNKEGIEFFQKYAPVGARDLSTMELLKKHGIPSYFSGCLTLTLEKREDCHRKDYILAVDISNNLLNNLRKRTERPIYIISPVLEYAKTRSIYEKFLLAELLLRLYQNAYCIVTSRLHVAMPSLAFETPILLVNNAQDQYRFSGLNNLVRNIEEDEYLENYKVFDLENPPQNSDEYLIYRESLVKKCKEFTGYDASKLSFLQQYEKNGGSIDALLMEFISGSIKKIDYHNVFEKIYKDIGDSIDESIERKKRRWMEYYYKIFK